MSKSETSDYAMPQSESGDGHGYTVRDEALAGKLAEDSFRSVIETLGQTSASDWPKLFPYGINEIEVEISSTTFKVSVKGPCSGNSPTGELDVDAGDTIPDDEPDKDIKRVLPPVITLLEESSAVYGTHAVDRRFGTARTIEAINQVAERYYAEFGIRLGIGDISKKGGGTISGHASHKRGVDVDVRVPRKDSLEKSSNYKDSSYSRERTQRLVRLFRSNGFPVTHIFFNDPEVADVSPWPNHDNHLHVRFEINAEKGNTA